LSNPTVSGQNLIDDIRVRLGGLANVFTVDQLLSFSNDGVGEVWSVIRSLDLDYFAASSQDTTATDDDFFLDLTTSTREYELPKNCRELRAIEVLTVGFEDKQFQFRRFDDPEFQEARRFSTAAGSGSGSCLAIYFYTVFGTRMLLAQYPETTLKAKLWYIKALDDIDIDSVPEILHPFNKKIVDFAVKKAILSTQNLEMALGWKTEWMDSVKTLAMSVGSRSSTNATFSVDYLGS
jgi:hypothetical protein